MIHIMLVSWDSEIYAKVKIGLKISLYVVVLIITCIILSDVVKMIVCHFNFLL